MDGGNFKTSWRRELYTVALGRLGVWKTDIGFRILDRIHSVLHYSNVRVIFLDAVI